MGINDDHDHDGEHGHGYDDDDNNADECDNDHDIDLYHAMYGKINNSYPQIEKLSFSALTPS